jgi:hypothetical protein
MLSSDEVVTLTGHPVGGVCPFGLENPLAIYCDISLKQYRKSYRQQALSIARSHFTGQNGAVDRSATGLMFASSIWSTATLSPAASWQHGGGKCIRISAALSSQIRADTQLGHGVELMGANGFDIPVQLHRYL